MVRRPRQWLGLSAFAIAMALVEAAVVVYLRQIYYPQDPLIIFPPNMLAPYYLAIEIARETATVVMILSVAWLAEKGFVRVFAAFVYIFGLWDIFYYLWLKLSMGWPVSWVEWDILFLIPWIWLGPWIAPVAIAILFAVWGGGVLRSTQSFRYITRVVSKTRPCFRDRFNSRWRTETARFFRVSTTDCDRFQVGPNQSSDMRLPTIYSKLRGGC